MESYIFVIAIIALYAFGITKFVYYKINKNSVKSKTSKQNDLVMKSGVVGVVSWCGCWRSIKRFVL